MSFFGFDTNLPHDRGRGGGGASSKSKHPQQAPGFSQTQDAFAALSLRSGGPSAAAAQKSGDDDGYDFEDTYDGLGDELDEAGDAFNDDTFGGEEIGGKETDFNYAENTAKVTNALQEEQVLYQGGTGKFGQQQHQPTQPPPQQQHQHQQQQQQQQQQHQYQYQQPHREQLRSQSSYTKPKNESLQQIPDLKPEMSLWQTTSASTTGSQARSKLAQAHYQHVEQRQTPPPTVAAHVPAPAGRKMMSLEEIEAQIKNQAKSRPQPVSMPSGGHSPVPFANQHQPYPNQIPQLSQHHMHQLQQQHQKQQQQNQLYNPNLNPNYHAQQQLRQDVPSANYGKPPIAFDSKPQQQQQQPQLSQSFRQQQNVPMMPNPQGFNSQVGPNQRQPQFAGNVPFSINNLGPLPNNLTMKPPTELTEEERVALVQEEQKRMRRNAKIAQLARYNGLMTPSDKNFISKIQLQQLVSVNDDAFSEDFYYQVHMAISVWSHPQQAPNQFAQTYLPQSGQGNMNGRNRRQDNHVQRMEQQVQRAVAAAKARPKASQLVLEGSLGKISFSNVKTPKPLLNIKRPELSSTNTDTMKKTQKVAYDGLDRKHLLKSLEDVYDNLLELELLERAHHLASQDPSNRNEAAMEEFQQKREAFLNKMWRALKIMEPINPSSQVPHPFIAILSYAKGKKAIPRAFRHIDNEQRVTILTMIVVHLDHLDVIKHAHYQPGDTDLPTSIREEIELFSQTVFPCLLSYVAEAPINMIIGLLGILLERVDVVFISQTRMGLAFLTMFASRAEIIRQTGLADAAELAKWNQTYNRLFTMLEDHIVELFPPQDVKTDDVYVWQFLASMAVGANMQQQQKLVTAVKDRVMENVMASKTLPPEQGAQKAANTNLFMRAIGLDIDLLA